MIVKGIKLDGRGVLVARVVDEHGREGVEPLTRELVDRADFGCQAKRPDGPVGALPVFLEAARSVMAQAGLPVAPASSSAKPKTGSKWRALVYAGAALASAGAGVAIAIRQRRRRGRR